MEINIQEEVYKCSKCGLCQSVCPLYLATKNEMLLPRGRYIVLNNFFNNRKKLSKKFIKNLDICLNCNLCKDFCPSSIDAEKIHTKLKNEHKSHFSFFPVLYFLSLFMHFIKRLFFINELYRVNVKRNRKKINTRGKVVYFQGCINKYINPSDKIATLNILEKLGYQVEKITSVCCGLPYLSNGDVEAFNKNSEKIFNYMSDDIEYLVCSCDSCFKTLDKIPGVANKLITLEKLLEINNIKMPVHSNVVYHKTLGRKNSLSNNMFEINKKGICTLNENFFLFKHKKIAEKLLKKLFYKKEDIDNKQIITTCQLSKIGLQINSKKIASNTRITSYSEYVDSVIE